jgi:DNA-binding CsgD family transcriptional regulator
MEIGTVRPGPRGRGWRVKTAKGWAKCDEHGVPVETTVRVQRSFADIIRRSSTLPVPAQLAPVRYPRPARPTSLASSVDRRRRAERASAGTLTPAEHEVLHAIAAGGGQGRSDMEVHLLMGLHLGTVSKRRHTLVDAGHVQAAGTREGRTVFVATEKGRRTLWG